MSDAVSAHDQHPALLRSVRAIDRGLSALDSILMVLVVMMMLAMMVLVSIDAALRYGFNQPLVFASDLVTLYLLPGAMFMALSYTLRRGGHIGVDVFVERMSPRCYNIVIGSVLLISLPVLAVMAMQVCRFTFESWAQQEMMIGLYEWALWPSKAIVAVSLVVLLVRVLFASITNLLAGFLANGELAIPIMPPRGAAAEDAV